MTITAAEAEFAAQFGVSPGEICGRKLADLLQEDSPAPLLHRLSGLSEGRSSWFRQEMIGRRDSGDAFAAELTAIAVADLDGPAGLVLLLRPAGETIMPRLGELSLSALDARVLEGVAGGASTSQLAGRLYLSRQGVEYRVGLLLRRFNVPNRAALVARAHALGLFAARRWPAQVVPEAIQ
ncbi:LuxR C-terminal-related transcriptional regulator [Streptomyces sp. NPDC015139]|uniref:LuxR C-terminal-related transcriptional regulator n=1 Tax=Streptomyces sp. NPDC015139 TaxID=3364942 RepID=UPI0036FAC163